MERNVLKNTIECLCMVILIAVMIVLPGSVGKSLAKEPIKIGFIGALATPFGKNDKAALEISIDEINKIGGILGRPVQLLVEDWKGEVPLAVSAYTKLVTAEKCSVVFVQGTEAGVACGQLGVRFYPSYPHLLFANPAPDPVTTAPVAKDYDKNKFIFRMCVPNKDLFTPAMGLIEFYKETMGAKKVALLIEDMAWTLSYRQGTAGVHPSLKEYLQKNGMQVVHYAITDRAEKMFLPILETLAKSGADTIIWATGHTDTVTLAKQWATSGAKDMNLVLYSGTSSFKVFPKMTGGRSLGVVNVSPEITIPYTKNTELFMKKMTEKGANFMYSTPGAADGPWILKGAMETVGSADDMDKVIKAMENGEFQHYYWIWKFDKQHEPKGGYPYGVTVFGQFQEDGKLVVVYPKELVKKTNPKAKFVPVKELQKRADQ